MTVYYVETELGCALVEARDADHAYDKTRREIGTYHNIGTVREASAGDIDWVAGMGGYIPKSAKQFQVATS